MMYPPLAQGCWPQRHLLDPMYYSDRRQRQKQANHRTAKCVVQGFRGQTPERLRQPHHLRHFDLNHRQTPRRL